MNTLLTIVFLLHEFWAEVIRKAVDLGVTFFDTAQGYTMGTNEELVGEAFNIYRCKNI